MDRAAYDDYLRKFNARDYDGVLAYYGEELEVVFAGYALRTRQEVKDFYQFFHQFLREEIEIRRFVADADTIAMEVDVRLTGIRELTPQMLAEKGFERLMAPPVGVTVTIPQFIHYHLRDGKLVKAYCAVYEPPHP